MPRVLDHSSVTSTLKHPSPQMRQCQPSVTRSMTRSQPATYQVTRPATNKMQHDTLPTGNTATNFKSQLLRIAIHRRPEIPSHNRRSRSSDSSSSNMSNQKCTKHPLSNPATSTRHTTRRAPHRQAQVPLPLRLPPPPKSNNYAQ